MIEAFLPTTPKGRMYRLIEKMGEVMQMISKCGRFGPHSANPFLLPNDQEANIIALERELTDLEHALHSFHVDVRGAILYDEEGPWE